MKPFHCLTLLLIFSVFATHNSFAQNQPGVDSTGLPGDNFSLQGALEMFQKASSPEEFEKMINSENNHVNNLDLNGDGDIDYIRVIDNADKDAHALVLQAIISESESQDIAVIELEKTGAESAMLQIVGDEDIYGEEVIVEPGEGDDAFLTDFSDNTIAHGPSLGYASKAPAIIVNVWLWPSVRFIYGPRYVVWRSPWRWHAYPTWWRPWRPVRWHVFHPFVRPYHTRFAVVRTHRVVVAHRVYKPIRVTSVSVRSRHAASVNNFRVTRSRTVVTGPRGNKAVKTTTKVKGPRGNTRVKSTKVRRR
jgi:hypothetical protein